jgi:hypothetical protein
VIRIEQGASWGRSWPISLPSGDPVTDFTGWTAKAQVRETPEATEVLFEWILGGAADKGTITLTGSAVELSHTGDDSDDWLWRLGRYDVKVTNAAGQEAFTARGRVMVIPAVTR